ncbi:11153_t:CDS:2 [Acaulospora colombiana]|uniref:11153_t:CDS:1 n=1 Tax=Acaulospora colombiana TaxID=27376 RepID=A0ACA9LMK3_9GLOM|nr:11153_t:CDS:2 [Acaulospora colombiana]
MARLSLYETSRIISLECVDSDVDEEIVKDHLSEFGKILKVQFWKSAKHDHAFVTFEDPEAAQYVLSIKNELTSRLPIKPVNRTVLKRYELPPSYTNSSSLSPALTLKATGIGVPNGKMRSTTPNPYSAKATVSEPEPRNPFLPSENQPSSYDPKNTPSLVQRMPPHTLPTPSVVMGTSAHPQDTILSSVPNFHHLKADVSRLYGELRNAYESNINIRSSLESALADLTRIRQERDRYRQESETAQQETRRLKAILDQQKSGHDKHINMQEELHRADKTILELRNDIKGKDTIIGDLEIQLLAAHNKSKHLRDVLEDKNKPPHLGTLSSSANEVGQTDAGDVMQQNPPFPPLGVDQRQGDLSDSTVGPTTEQFQRVGPELVRAFYILDQIASSVIKQDQPYETDDGPGRKKRKLNET